MSNYIVQQNLKENNEYKTIDYYNKNVEGISVDNLFPANNNNFSGYGNTALRANYDIVIRTQAEFDALLASPNWFGAKSVLIVAKGIAYFEVYDSIIIPSNVEYIDGLNSASIYIHILSTNTKDSAISSIVGNCEINNLSISITTDIDIIGLYKINKITNCNIFMISRGDPSPRFTAINYCFNILNTRVTCQKQTEGDTEIKVFSDCNNICNCDITSEYWRSKAFYSCKNISNCVVSYNGTAAFDFCERLTNINLSSTVPAGQSTSLNSGFFNCEQLSNCVVSNGIFAFPFETSFSFVNCGVGENATYNSVFKNCTKINTNNCDS